MRYRGEPLGQRFREEAGILFQKTALQDFLTVRQCLAMFRGLYDRGLEVEELIKLCALEKLAGRDNSKLSGGQQQRLLLAIALVNDPALIFLDEPTTGLDPQARRNFWELIQSIKARRKTVILTTHYMEEAELLCDEIAIMDNGKIIAQGTPRNLLNEHFAEVLLELPRHEFPQAARAPALDGDRGQRPHRNHHQRPGCDAADAHGCPRAPAEPADSSAEPGGSVPGADRQGAARMINRLLSVWHARNLEFVRDRSTLLFTLVMPVMLIVGMSFVFGGQERPLFKVGVLGAAPLDKSAHPFLHERFVDFVPIASESDGLHKVTHQQIDLLDLLRRPARRPSGPRYWVNTDSPKGYIVEKLLLASAPAASASG